MKRHGGNYRKFPFMGIYLGADGKIDTEYAALLNGPGWSISQTHGIKYAYYRKTKNGLQKTITLHRLIMGRVCGRKLKTTELVDHINGNGLDNRVSNMRICSNSENLRNRVKLPRDNKSGYMGVTACKQTGKWAAEIRVNGTKIWLGRHSTKDDAVQIRRIAEKKYWGSFAPKWD